MPLSIKAIYAESAFFNSLDNSHFDGCTEIEIISLEGLAVDSPIPTEWRDIGVEFIYVYDSGLTGSLDNLVYTDPTDGSYSPTEIWIDRNSNMTGTIPKELANNVVVSYSFTENNLSGTIPTEFGDMFTLRYLWLYGNNLIGNIPTELALLPRITLLRVENNTLTGTVPTEICTEKQTGFPSYLFDIVGADPSLCLNSCCDCTNIEDCDVIQDGYFQ